MPISEGSEEFRHKLNTLRKKPIIWNIILRLRHELPIELIYHNYWHTEEVIEDAVLFALTDDLPARQVELLAVAAAYHDAGFLVSRQQNEPIGAEMAIKAMREAGGYSEEEIAQVQVMILDTALFMTETGLHQKPTSELSKYLLDADLSNFGRRDFFDKNARFHVEINSQAPTERKKYLRDTAQLLKNHHWHTGAATAVRERQKVLNMEVLESLIEDLDFVP